MYFTADTPLFRYEIMMQGIPNFLPRGHGIHVTVTKVSETIDCEYCLFFNRKKCTLPRCPYIEDKIRTGTASIRQIMTETMSEIHCERFWDRLNQYIKESENSRMNDCNKKHEKDFNKALERIDNNNEKLVSAVYLLTADTQLWRRVQNHVEKNCIRFDKMNLGSVDEKAYTLFCSAKDLYLGTKHLTIADLADEQLISPKMFGIICNALAIRRFGIGVLNQN